MQRTELVASLLEQAGVGWMLRGDRLARAEQVEREIADLQVELTRRLTPQAIDLLRELELEAVALKPLAQLFATPTSVAIRAMAYCLLRGMDIHEIEFRYRLKQAVQLDIVLSDPVTGRKHEFASALVWDVEVLRHIGIMTLSDRPVLHGFYAFAGT